MTAAIESGRVRSADELAVLLLTVDRDGDPQLLADAEQLLLQASPRLWLMLDVAIRPAWRQARRWSGTAVQRLVQGESSPLGLTVAACHPDGHVREAAVARLTGPPDPGAVAGLGETGSADDAGLVAAWLEHPRPRARAEAVRALRRLGGVDPERLFGMLTDPSGAVTRQITVALRPSVSRLDLPRLRRLLSTSNPQHTRMAAYRLLHERDTWTRLLTDLELANDPSPLMRHRARGDITTWLAREAATTYSKPRGSTADALAEQLRAAQDALGPDRARLLRFHLGLGPSSVRTSPRSHDVSLRDSAVRSS
ncbi:HEAT repeat domain-containing protein [Streptomyces sp. NPDC014889]|uniref:HEAT repeat domain-containing protein n=1 Tax=Streptomyces sp. NPDC014889 TaxID=3364928 RepID=UPI0036FE461D